MIIPVYFISLYLNLLGTNFLKEEMSQSMFSNVEFYGKNLEDEIGRIKVQQWQMLNVQDLLKLSVSAPAMTSYDTVGLIKNVQERLNIIHNSSPYIENIGVYIKSMAKTISTQYGVENVSDKDLDFLIQYYESETQETLFYYQERLFLVEPFSIHKRKVKKELEDTVYIELSIPEIQQTLEALTIYKGSGAFLVDHDLKFYFTQKGEEMDFEIVTTLVEQGEEKGQYQISIGNKQKYWMIHKDIKFLDMKLISYIPESYITSTLRKYDIWLGILSLASIGSIFIFALLINHMIHQPMIKFVNAFKALEAENLDVSIEYYGYDEFSYLYRAFNKMVKRLKSSIQEVYERKIAAQQSELKQLQSQINPHFLYNSFFHIYRMCKFEDYENVERLTQKLGSYYQFITRSGAEEVPLHMEFNHAKNYVDIQSMRFSNRIQVEFEDLPNECRDLMVPRLILQPIIENAYEHGFENRVEGGKIWIHTKYEKQLLCITVEDNGPGMGEHALQSLQEKLVHTDQVVEKTGIVNVSRRLHLKYGQGSGLQVSKSSHGGLKVEVIIKWKEGERDVSNPNC